jgi:hypothetical protein
MYRKIRAASQREPIAGNNRASDLPSSFGGDATNDGRNLAPVDAVKIYAVNDGGVIEAIGSV